jgi:hypothetical protein
MMIGIGTPRSQSKIARPNLSSLADASLTEISNTTVGSSDLFRAVRPAHAKSRVPRDTPSARISGARDGLLLEPKSCAPVFPRIPTQGDRCDERQKPGGLFHDTLRHIYFVEKKILGALPKMAKAAQSQNLKAAFQEPYRVGPTGGKWLVTCDGVPGLSYVSQEASYEVAVAEAAGDLRTGREIRIEVVGGAYDRLGTKRLHPPSRGRR